MSIKDATFRALKVESNVGQLHAELLDTGQMQLTEYRVVSESIFCDIIQGRDSPILNYLPTTAKIASNATLQHAELVQSGQMYLVSDHISAESILLRGDGYKSHGLTETIVTWPSFWSFFIRLLGTHKS